VDLMMIMNLDVLAMAAGLAETVIMPRVGVIHMATHDTPTRAQVSLAHRKMVVEDVNDLRGKRMGREISGLLKGSSLHPIQMIV